MKKKVFSLMMTFVLAFMGVARADVVEIGVGGTSTNSYLPSYSFYNYTLSQQLYTADEIGTAGTINSIAIFNGGSEKTRTYTMYLVNTDKTEFTGSYDWITVTAADQVFTGSVTMTAGAWTTFTLTTPFTYDGTSNLALIMDDNTGSWSSGLAGRVFTSTSNCSMYVYSDGTNYDPFAPTSYYGTRLSVKNQLQIDITPSAGGTDKLHVKYVNADEEEVVDSLNLGVRPAGCWMEPFAFTMYSEGPNYTVTVLDFTPSDGMFAVEGEELPFQVAPDADVEMTIGTTENAPVGVIERQFVAITEGNRAAHIWPIVVEMYDPEVPDVWEKACTEATSFPFSEIPSTAHNIVLHDDYNLPFTDSIPDGPDAVYKLVINSDQIINAYVDTLAENGKVALYTEDFYGEGGPMAHNYYQGLLGGENGGAAAAPYEVQIGEGTSSTGYFPMYYLYNYSLSTQLFLGTELTEAGATTAPMTSVSWYSTSGYNYNVQNVSIWMANVSDGTVNSTSPLGSTMTLVYQGNFQEVAGWNEFVFNQGSFAWDGQSNVLVMTQMNNGSWSSAIQWQCHNPGFQAGGYNYTDYNTYNAQTTSYSLYTSSTTRANTIFKSATGRYGRETVTIGTGTGSTNNMPFNTSSSWKYGHAQFLYTADELIAAGGHAGYITEVGFQLNREYTMHFDGVRVFLTTTTATELTTNAAIAMTSSDVEAYNGELDIAGSGWYTITLTTPFYWDGTSTLVVTTLSHNTNSPSSYTQGWAQTTGLGAYRGFYSENMSSPLDPYNPSNGSFGGRQTRRANIQFGFGEAPTPVNPVTPGATNVNVSAGPVIEDLPVRPGTYYLVASATQDDYEVFINAEPMPCPAVEGFAFNPMPEDDEDEVEPASVTLRWNIPEYATGWRLIFGSTYHPEPNHPQTIMYPEDGSFTTEMANSYTVTNLWNNTNYFWRVEFNNGACTEGVSSPVWGFTTHLNIPQNLTAEDYTIFNDEQVVLHWNAIQDRTFRTYYIYRDDVKIGETTTNNINATSFTDGPLAYNINGYNYYVTAVYDEGESNPSNTVNVKVSGRGNVNGHVYEQDGTTGIAGATVTMVGTDEFGDSHTYTFTTDANGYYSGAVYAGSYNGQAACNGYQTIEEPVQGNPINITYNVTTSPVDYILDENFDPVCTVIAEYYPDSLDPESPYVKVYWGCGLPGEEIVEPFETGDFSLFDWQLDPTYPWTITTTNPYEGTYCMKSGGAGVAYAESNMTVTVDIPADGIMSFFGKISSETNWDYGYFFIDGVQKGSYTGAGTWAERTFDVTAGSHTFQWRYTKDGSVNSNDDCFYVDYITFYRRPEPAIPGMTYDFENGGMQGWTTIDADGDGFTWMLGSELMGTGYGHDGSNDLVLSQSYSNSYGALNPDNYLVSPQVQLGGLVRFYACAQDASYAAEHFGLAVSTTSNNNPSAFTMVQEWTMTAKGGDGAKPVDRNTRSGRAQGTWYEYTVDLSAYSGMGYVAIRHFNCTDMFYLDVDDITIGEPGKGLDNNRAFSHYRVYRTNCYNDGPYTLDNTVVLACELHDTIYIDVEWADLAPGVYKWGVGCVYVGNRGEEIESEITWTEPTIVEGPVRDEPVIDTLQEPRESEIVWSNCLDKDMYLDHVTVNVLLNSADSPEGTVVALTNLNEYEQMQYPVEPVTLDGSGFYAWPTFRRGEYAVSVRLDGYEPIFDTVSIWQNTDLRYVMTEILYGTGNIYVSRTGWAMWGDDVPGGGGGGGGGNAATSFNEDFEGGLNGWTVLDVNADGGTWVHSNNNPGGYSYGSLAHGGSGFAMCYSYIDYQGAYNTNSFLITPQKYSITANSHLTFWADNANDSYPENFSVCVATADNPGANDFTTVWSGGAKGKGGDKAAVRHDDDRYQNWRSHDIDLSAYAGQDVYIAFHDVNYDEYEIWIDDVELTSGAKDGERHFEYYKVMCTSIDGVPIFNHNTVHPFCQLSTNEPYNAPLVEGEHYLCKVAVMYSTGMSAWTEPVEWVYEPCDHWGPVDFVEVDDNGQGNHLTWAFDHGFNPYGGETPGPQPGTGDWYYYDNGTNVDAIGTNGGNFWWGVMFPAGSYTGNMVTKVSAYDYMAMSGNVTIYTGGATAPGTSVGQTNVTFTGSSDFVEFEFAEPVAIDPTQNVWVVFYNGSGATFPAAVCDNTGDANGRWVSLDGSTWADLASYGLDYTFMVRAYIASGRGTTQQVNVYGNGDGGTLAISGNGPRIREGEGIDFVMTTDYTAEFNIADMANFDGRVYFLHQLYNDSRFSVINAEQNGVFIVSANGEMNLREAFGDFVEQTTNNFARMDKYAAADYAAQYKGTLPMSFVNALMMDIYAQSRENNLCATADPFCTDNGMYEFPAGVNAGSGESGPDYDCLYTQPNPAWYYMRISDPGDMDIYMYSTPSVDIDFCCWGPFDDPTTPCPYGLTEDKVVSCSYSTAANEHCMIPATAQTGEYYILVITNYSNQTCNINFSKVGGSGSTDCTIMDVDIIGFLITQDGEYLDIVGPTVREYTDLGEFGEHEYCVRPIYPGLMNLPEENYGWSMGCPVCEFSSGEGCASNIQIHGEALPSDQARIWWNEDATTTDVTMYNVYRSTDNANYSLVGSVPFVDGRTEYEYIDTPTFSNDYYYQVRTVYTDGCESVPAVNAENGELNFVHIAINLGVDDNSGKVALFPNPTNGNVTIQAQGMNRITVVSVLGQVVYDTELSADEYILNMAQFNAGMYMVRVSTENGVVVKRVTVMQ